MYDRTLLRNAAAGIGDSTSQDIANRLKVARPTAWRLLTGRTAPSGRVAAAVERAYGVPAAALMTPAKPAPKPTPEATP